MKSIPGYYYDEAKNRYFRITNGATRSPYHNEIVQSARRTKRFRKNEHAEAPQAQHSVKRYAETIRRNIIRKKSGWLFNSVGLRLGLMRLTADVYVIERFKRIRLLGDIGLECDSVFKASEGNYFFLLRNYDRQIIARRIPIDYLLLTSPSVSDNITIDDGTFSQDYSGYECLNNLFRNNGKFVFRYRLMHDLQIGEPSPELRPYLASVGFKMFKDHTLGLENNILHSFVLNMRPSLKLKYELVKLFSFESRIPEDLYRESENYGLGGHEINDSKPQEVTGSFLDDKLLILGTDKGICYIFKYAQSGIIESCKKIQVCQKHAAIRNITVTSTHYVISGGKNLFFLDKKLRKTCIIKHEQIINHFFVFESGIVLLVGLTSMTIHNYKSDPSRVSLRLPYRNNNITHQAVTTTSDFLVINESNDTLFLVNFNTFDASRIHIPTHVERNSRLESMFIYQNLLFINWTSQNGNSCKYFEF